MGTRNTLMPLWDTLRGGLTYLLRDIFTTPDAAPITSPRTCEPGPGTLTATQTDGTLAAAGNKLAFTAQATPTWGDQGFYGSAQTRDSGLALSAKTNLTTWEEMGLGWHTATAVVDPDSAEHAIQANTTNGRFDDENATPIATGLSASTDYNLTQVLRSVGCHYLRDGKLLWVDDAGATSTLYPMFSNLDGAGSIDDLVVVDLPANGYTKWDADFSTVTDSKTNPATTTTFDCEADHHLPFTLTIENTKFAYVYTRFTNTINALRFEITTARVLRVRDYIAGSPETLYLGSQLTDGVSYKFDFYVEGQAYKLFIDNVLVSSGNITSTANSSTTGGRVDHNLASNDIVLSTHPYPSLGIATSRIIAPQANDTATHEADCVFYARNVNLPTAGSLQYELRKSGSDEITLDIDSNGKPIIKENADARITGSNADVSEDDDVAVVLDGSSVSLFAAGSQIGSTYSSLTLTGGSTFNMASIGTAGSTNSVEFWPRDLSSLLPSELR